MKQNNLSKCLLLLQNLVHPSDELVDIVFAVSSISSFDVVIPLPLQTTQGCRELEWPEEVVGFLEVRPNCQDLMDKIFDADDPVLAKGLGMNGQVSVKN